MWTNGKGSLCDWVQGGISEAVKEYIGMVKLYYEEAKRVQGEPEGMASMSEMEPQNDARVIAHGAQGNAQVEALEAKVQEMQEISPRKRSRTARDVKMQGIFGTKARLVDDKKGTWNSKRNNNNQKILFCLEVYREEEQEKSSRVCLWKKTSSRHKTTTTKQLEHRIEKQEEQDLNN